MLWPRKDTDEPQRKLEPSWVLYDPGFSGHVKVIRFSLKASLCIGRAPQILTWQNPLLFPLWFHCKSGRVHPDLRSNSLPGDIYFCLTNQIHLKRWGHFERALSQISINSSVAHIYKWFANKVEGETFFPNLYLDNLLYSKWEESTIYFMLCYMAIIIPKWSLNPWDITFSIHHFQTSTNLTFSNLHNNLTKEGNDAELYKHQQPASYFFPKSKCNSNHV